MESDKYFRQILEKVVANNNIILLGDFNLHNI